MMRKTGAAVVAILFALGSSAFAADTTTSPSKSPLAPGKASGIQAAQSFWSDNTDTLLIGAGVVIVGVALIASNHGHHHSTPDSGSPSGT